MMITATSCYRLDRFFKPDEFFFFFLSFRVYFLQKVCSAPAPSDKYCIV